MSGRVIIASGGTGGHMFPAIALGEALGKRRWQVGYTVDQRGRRYLGHEDHLIVPSASPSGSLARRLKALIKLAYGVVVSTVWLLRRRPSAVAAFGGYASVPTGIAATLLLVPLLLHEQNAVLGRAHRLFARWARVLALTFADTKHLPEAKVRVEITGNPVRSGFAPGDQAQASSDRRRLFVMGGSQGARVLSEAVPAAVALLPADLRTGLQVVQQCRAEDLEAVRQAYAELGLEAEVATFFDDVPAQLAAADLVISRAGASSIAELLVTGSPSILIPFAAAADDHQTANARVLAVAGAALLIPQNEVDGPRLAAPLAELLGDDQHLQAMAIAARNLARPNAAEHLADLVEEVAR
ncbi:MAG: undecaprenyldiphospho-muramoylpentapeptide beta-N-acetylglucosaminyltransferase [Geminicoccaceae bacterium]